MLHFLFIHIGRLGSVGSRLNLILRVFFSINGSMILWLFACGLQILIFTSSTWVEKSLSPISWTLTPQLEIIIIFPNILVIFPARGRHMKLFSLSPSFVSATFGPWSFNYKPCCLRRPKSFEKNNLLFQYIRYWDFCWFWGVCFKWCVSQVLCTVLEANKKMFPQYHISSKIILCKINRSNF